jgi:hypothetical protein
MIWLHYVNYYLSKFIIKQNMRTRSKSYGLHHVNQHLSKFKDASFNISFNISLLLYKVHYNMVELCKLAFV